MKAAKDMRKDAGVKIITLCLIGNVFLLALKGAVGFWTGSEALKADAINSAGDVLSAVVVLLGLGYALKPRDKDHHYGHGKMEALVSFVVGLMVIAGTGFIAYEAIANAVAQTVSPPSWFALGAALVSITVKAFMFKATFAAGKKLRSIAVMTNAMDHRNDIFATSGAVLAIALAFIGQYTGIRPLMLYSEPVIAVAICAVIVKTAVGIIAEASRMLLDAAPDEDTMDALRKLAAGVPGAKRVCWLKCRCMGRGLLVDVAIDVSGEISVSEGHSVADGARDAIIDAFPQVADVIVHINPETKIIKNKDK